MMINDYLDESRVRLDVEVRSKKHALQLLSEMLAQANGSLSAQRIFDAMFQRERLGCTGLGHGVALPHARLPGLKQCIGAFLRTTEPIRFESDDGEDVELIFAMIFAEDSGDENMYNLSHIATLFMDAKLRQQLRDAQSAEQAHQALIAAALPPPDDVEAGA